MKGRSPFLAVLSVPTSPCCSGVRLSVHAFPWSKRRSCGAPEEGWRPLRSSQTTSRIARWVVVVVVWLSDWPPACHEIGETIISFSVAALAGGSWRELREVAGIGIHGGRDGARRRGSSQRRSWPGAGSLRGGPGQVLCPTALAPGSGLH